MHRTKLYLKLVAMLPGTFLHELAHYLPALLFCRNVKLSVIPSLKEATAGRVTYSKPTLKITETLIAVMPIVWWPVLLWILEKAHVMIVQFEPVKLNILLQYNPQLSATEYALLVYVALQGLWAGSLSKKDWENAIDGLISYEGIILGAGVLCVYLYGSEITAYIHGASGRYF